MSFAYNQHSWEGAPLLGARIAGDPIAITYTALGVDVSSTSSQWKRLLNIPFVTARNSLVFATFNFCGNCDPTSGSATACQLRLIVTVDATTSTGTVPFGQGSWAGNEYLGDLTMHSSNQNDEQQVEAVYLIEGLGPGPHLLTIDAQAVDGVTTNSGNFVCNASSNPWLHGCSVILEEYAR